MTITAIGYIVFLIAAGFTAVISAMLYYHWVRYGVEVIGTLAVMVIYGLGTAAILMALLSIVAQV